MVIKPLLIIIFLGLQWHTSASFRILAFFPISFPSHLLPLHPFFYELATRGHHVTLLSAYPPPKNHSNLNYQQLPKSYSIKGLNLKEFRDISGHALIRLFSEFYLERTKEALNIPQVRHFIRNDDSKFDVIIASLTYCGESFTALGHKYKAPMINFQPLGYTPFVFYTLGSLNLPTVMPDYRQPYTSNMSFLETMSNVYLFLLDFFEHKFYYQSRAEEMMDREFVYPGAETRPDMSTLLKNISMTFIEYDPHVGTSYPVAPNVIFTGGMQLGPAKPLPTHMETFMNSAPNGVVYISLGSLLQFSSLPKHVTEGFVEAIKRLKYKVIWKTDIKVDVPPEDVMVDTWFPQSDILGHPNCKLFITHGGVHSAMEAAYHGVPLVMMPGFSDQFQNVKVMQERGMGVVMELETVTSDVVYNTVEEVISNPKYKEKMKQISKSMKTKPVTSLEKAVQWTEYVAENQGAPNLRPNSRNVSLIRILGIDIIILVCIIVMAISVFIILIVVKCRKLIKKKID